MTNPYSDNILITKPQRSKILKSINKSQDKLVKPMPIISKSNVKLLKIVEETLGIGGTSSSHN